MKPNVVLLAALRGHSLDTINTFDLSSGYFGAKQVEVISRLLPDCPFLESVSVAGNSITSPVVERLCAGLARGIVQRVDLSNNPMDIHCGQRILETLRKNIAITACNVAGCMLPDYLVHDITVQTEMNELLFRKREVEKKEAAASLVSVHSGSNKARGESACEMANSTVLNFDEISNAEDIECLAAAGEDVDDDNCEDSNASCRLLLAPSAVHTDGDASNALLRSITLSSVPVASIGTNESIKETISSVMKEGVKFTDHTFSVCSNVSTTFWSSNVGLGHSSSAWAPNSLCWMRFPDFCSEIGVAPTILGKTLVVSSLLKGTRWLECAVSVVRECDSLRSVVCQRALPDMGLYHFAFFKGDSKVEIVVDDWVPVVRHKDTNELRLACLHNEDPSDAWAALLEKAYAKLHGGYAQLIGGSMRYALEDLTGGICCKTTWTVSSVRKMGRESFFRTLRDHIIHRKIVAAKAGALGELQQSSHAAAGIASNRSYLVTNAMQLNDGRTLLVQLVSPSSKLVWCGKFGPGSLELENTPELQQSTGSSVSTHFWLLLEDFVSMFDCCYVLNHVPSLDISLRVMSVDGQTASASALLGTAHWMLNDSFTLSTTVREAHLLIRILQCDARLTHGKAGDRAGPGFSAGLEAHVVRADCTYDGWGTEQCCSSCGDETSLIRGRELVLPVVVRRDVPLRLVVSSDRDDVRYQLIASSTRSQFSIQRNMPGRQSVATYKGVWEGLRASGRHHHACGITQSIHLQISLDQQNSDTSAGDVTILIDQGNSHVPYSIGLVGKRGSSRVQSAADLHPSLEVGFLARRTVGTVVRLVGNECCVCIPMTWNSGEEGEYCVSCISDSRNVRIVELKP